MFVKEMADRIARDIFECGDELNRPTDRIQFIGLDGNGNEKTQGGLCESALSLQITVAIKKHFKSL